MSVGQDDMIDHVEKCINKTIDEKPTDIKIVGYPDSFIDVNTELICIKTEENNYKRTIFLEEKNLWIMKNKVMERGLNKEHIK